MPPRRLLWLALLLAAAARLPALFLGMEHYGDGPVRVEIAERWARTPHLWRGFSETFQFGPLHLTLLGGTLELWPDRLWPPRLLSLFCALAALPVPFWLWQNARTSGDWLAPIHYIDRDHEALATMALSWFGQLRWRAYCLFYWPLAVLVLVTPLVGLLSLAGAARALWRRTAGWELAAIAWIPAVYFTFRGAVLADFRPLSRFALVAAAP